VLKESLFYRVRRYAKLGFVYLILTTVAVSCLFPLWWMFVSALKTRSTIFSDFSLWPAHPHWENFYYAWTKGGFGTYFLNSVFYTVTVVFFIVLFSSWAAYAFSRLEFPFKNFLYLLLIASMMIPIPGAFIALFVLLKMLGLVNTRIGYILPQINAGLAFAIFLLRTFFDKLPRDLEDAARIDGCSRLGIWWHVVMPLARPALAVVIIFNTLMVWNEYLLALLVLQDKSKMPLTRGLMVFQGVHLIDYPLLMAGMTITVIPVILVYLLMQRHIIKGITAGALTGQ